MTLGDTDRAERGAHRLAQVLWDVGEVEPGQSRFSRLEYSP
jgi:hypothetical protein